MTEYKEGDTYRTTCGRGRITYHPELAIPYFKNKGMHLDLTKKS